MKLTPRRGAAVVTGLAYLSTIVAANWAIARFGAVGVGFGLLAPAGVWAAGFAFTFRDLLHKVAGREAVLLAVIAGTALSFLVAEPALALASALAFGVSELLDMVIYTPLAERRWLVAVAASNAVGLVVDSLLFLWVAYGSFEFLRGQIVGKAWITLAFLPVLAVGRWAWRRQLRRAEA